MMNVIWWHDRLWSCHHQRGIVTKTYIGIYSSYIIHIVHIDYLWTSLFKLTFFSLTVNKARFLLYFFSGFICLLKLCWIWPSHTLNRILLEIETVESLLRRWWPFGHLRRYFPYLIPFDHLWQRWSNDINLYSICI